MPAGTGYLSRGATWLSDYFSEAATGAMIGASKSGATSSWGARAAGLASRALGGRFDPVTGTMVGGFANMGVAGQRAIVGGLGGGMYGVFADDTSILGGAMIGAGIGAGSAGVGALGRTGYGAYRRTMGLDPGLGRGRALANAFVAMGQQSKGFIGQSYNKAIGGFKALGPRIDDYLWG